MTVGIRTTAEKLFRKWWAIVNTQRTDKLTESELDVMSKLLYIDYLYSHHSREKRNIIIFHSETKKRIRESLNNMSKQTFNNILLKLRKKNLITLDSINITIPRIVDNKFSINITFEITEND